VRHSVRLPILIALLTLTWALLWGDFGLANLMAGLAVSIFVVVISAPTGVTTVQRVSIHPVSVLVFVTYFLFQLVKSSMVVAWEIITPGSRLNRAIIAVPLRTSTEGLVTLIGNSVTLTPGTLTVDVHEADPEAATPTILYVHVLQVGDVELARESVLRLERLAVKAFGTRDQLAALDDAPIEERSQ